MARIKTYYFSPTDGTLQVARHLAETLGRLLHAEVEYHSYTLPREREELPQFDADDIILWATPVYAGRIPNKTLDFVRTALTHSSIHAIKQSFHFHGAKLHIFFQSTKCCHKKRTLGRTSRGRPTCDFFC